MAQTLVERLAAAALSALVAIVAGWAIKKTWTLVTGSEPPNPEDPEVPARQAVTWFLASGVGVGVAQLLFHRSVAKRRAFGRPVHG